MGPNRCSICTCITLASLLFIHQRCYDYLSVSEHTAITTNVTFRTYVSSNIIITGPCTYNNPLQDSRSLLHFNYKLSSHTCEGLQPKDDSAEGEDLQNVHPTLTRRNLNNIRTL